MKSLIESLFDDKLIEKDLFDNPEFKRWLNQPNTLWYIYYYWENGEEDWLHDFMRDEWKTYKPLVDEVLKILTKKMESGNGNFTWYSINFDAYDYDTDVSDKFTDYEEFADMMNDANWEIVNKNIKNSEEKDGIIKMQFKGALPKNSNVTALLQELELPLAAPNKLNGGIFLTNEDTIIVLGFPRGIDKKILELFNVK